MQRIDTHCLVSIRCPVVIAALFFSGCSILSPTPVPVDPAPIATPEPQPEIVIVAPEPAPKPEAKVAVPAPPELPTVAIFLTGDQPAYADVAEALTHRFENYRLFNLDDNSRTPSSAMRLINDSESDAVVAIGLRAAQSAVAMSDKPVVFSQVFNYQEHKLLRGGNRGVAAFAPLAAQIAAWVEFNPDLARIGTIVGPGHEELIEAAQLAAEEYGIELHVAVTHSDQETQFVFKRMVRDIDGFWLFPDNRVLSRRALLEIMNDAERQDVSVLVPSESMLQIGASISISTVASNIADTISNIIRKIKAGELTQVPPLSQLSEIRVRTNIDTRLVNQ